MIAVYSKSQRCSIDAAITVHSHMILATCYSFTCIKQVYTTGEEMLPISHRGPV